MSAKLARSCSSFRYQLREQREGVVCIKETWCESHTTTPPLLLFLFIYLFDGSSSSSRVCVLFSLPRQHFPLGFYFLFYFLPTEEILVCFWVRREQCRAAAVCHCFYIDILLVCLAGPLESPVLTSTSTKGLSLYIYNILLPLCAGGVNTC